MKAMDKALTIPELVEMAKEKPVVVWVVCLDEETSQPDLSTGEWQMFDGYDFSAPGVEDDLRAYGVYFVAFHERQADPAERGGEGHG
jgi:hypothetical protein